MIQIKRGVTREVILVGRRAVKIPSLRSWSLFLTGLLCNMQEAAWAGCHPRLCPVRFAAPGGFVVVMDRCDPITEEEFNLLDAADFPRHVEPKVCSFGRLGGRVVAVDYG